MEETSTLYFSSILLQTQNQRRYDEGEGKQDTHTEFSWGNLSQSNHFENRDGFFMLLDDAVSVAKVTQTIVE
jgi:hypothetical protein